MSLLTAASAYVERMLSQVAGMKALLVDEETCLMLSLCVPYSALIASQVFLTERIDQPEAPHNAWRRDGEDDDKPSDAMHHLRAVVFVRPVASSLHALKRLLASRRFRHVHLYLSAMISDELLRLVAAADVHESIVTVHEFFFDFYALHAHLFHLKLPMTRSLRSERAHWSPIDKAKYRRHVDGLISAMLALKKQCEIRFEADSPLCRFIASELHRRVSDDRELFDFGAKQQQQQQQQPLTGEPSPPLLLVLDRRSDPVTPLLTQWTYTAMCHELLTITHNRVDLATVRTRPAAANESTEFVLSMESDHFYRGSAWLNFGDLGASIKDLVLDFQRKTSSHAKLDTIEAMQRFVDHYPEFRALSGTVSKHVSVVSELSRIVDQRKLLSVSECEQELACVDDIATANDKVEKLLKDSKVQFDDALRLVMLYHLRYENVIASTDSQLPRWRSILRNKAGADVKKRQRVMLVDEIVRQCGIQHRSGQLFEEAPQSLFARASQLLSSGVRGVENIYTQHKPLLSETLASIMQGRASDDHFPSTNGASMRASYKFIIVFIAGGATYEESALVESLNKGSSGIKILLGGSCIHNSASFMDDLMSMPSSLPVDEISLSAASDEVEME